MTIGDTVIEVKKNTIAFQFDGKEVMFNMDKTMKQLGERPQFFPIDVVDEFVLELFQSDSDSDFSIMNEITKIVEDTYLDEKKCIAKNSRARSRSLNWKSMKELRNRFHFYCQLMIIVPIKNIPSNIHQSLI